MTPFNGEIAHSAEADLKAKSNSTLNSYRYGCINLQARPRNLFLATCFENPLV